VGRKKTKTHAGQTLMLTGLGLARGILRFLSAAADWYFFYQEKKYRAESRNDAQNKLLSAAADNRNLALSGGLGNLKSTDILIYFLLFRALRHTQCVASSGTEGRISHPPHYFHPIFLTSGKLYP
jgi:hypothetical protein